MSDFMDAYLKGKALGDSAAEANKAMTDLILSSQNNGSPAYLNIFASRWMTFKGREKRGAFWLFAIACNAIAGLADHFLSVHQNFVLIIFLFLVTMGVPTTVRRIRDAGYEWWWAFVPVANWVIAFTKPSK